MWRLVGGILLLGLCGTPPPAPGQSLLVPSDLLIRSETAADADSLFVLADGSPLIPRRFGLVYSHSGPGPYAEFTYRAPPAWELGRRRVEMSRLDCSLKGAQMGSSMGIMVGMLGAMGGAWDDPTMWAVAGAGAALGAIWGSTVGAGDPKFRVRYEWKD